MLKLPKATPAPDVPTQYKPAIPFAYLYILALVFLILWEVISFSNFTAYVTHFSMAPDGTKSLAYAITLLALQVFALPFLLRFKLSPAARFLSALCSLLVPMFWAVVILVGQPDNYVMIACSFALIVWAALAFMATGGPQALLPKKS
jgi:hypothetical protein